MRAPAFLCSHQHGTGALGQDAPCVRRVVDISRALAGPFLHAMPLVGQHGVGLQAANACSACPRQALYKAPFCHEARSAVSRVSSAHSLPVVFPYPGPDPDPRPTPGVDTVSALILGRSGGSAEQSKSFLSQTMGRTDHYLSLLNNDMLGSLSKFLPQPPQFDTPAVRRFLLGLAAWGRTCLPAPALWKACLLRT